MSGPIRVAIADDHAVVRQGLNAMLGQEPDIDVVGEACSGPEAVDLCSTIQPDMLLLDLSMPGHRPAATVEGVLAVSPATRIVILTGYNDPVAARTLMTLGAVGYILKDEDGDTLVSAIRMVDGGAIWMSGEVSDALLARAPSLTHRQEDLLRLLRMGLTDAAIAAELGLKEQTTRNYLHRLYEKLGVSSRTEAIAWALQQHPTGREDAPRP